MSTQSGAILLSVSVFTTNPSISPAIIGYNLYWCTETSLPVAYPKTKKVVKPTGDNRFPFQSL
jgi:hypothetical protein